MKTYNLEPIYDTRKSFYGKAKVIENNDTIDLISYTTNVARIENGKIKVFGWFSQTTARHINEFLQQYGFYPMTKKEMEQQQEWTF